MGPEGVLIAMSEVNEIALRCMVRTLFRDGRQSHTEGRGSLVVLGGALGAVSGS